jgi:hypothetical protein
VLEGSAFALRDILEAMRGAGLAVRRITMVFSLEDIAQGFATIKAGTGLKMVIEP